MRWNEDWKLWAPWNPLDISSRSSSSCSMFCMALHKVNTLECSLDGFVAVESESLSELDPGFRLAHIVLGLAGGDRIGLVDGRA